MAMSDQRRAYRDLSLNREELFEVQFQKASDTLILVQEELTSRLEHDAAREAALLEMVERDRDEAERWRVYGFHARKGNWQGAMFLFGAGVVSVPAAVGLIALIRAIF